MPTDQEHVVDQKEGVSDEFYNRTEYTKYTESLEYRFKTLKEELLRPHIESTGWTPDYFINEEYFKFAGTPTAFCDQLETYFKPTANSTPATWKVWPFIEKWIQQERQKIEIMLNPTAEPKTQPEHITVSANILGDQYESGARLTWSCKPAVAGYIISELIRAGYVEPPTTNGDLSYSKLADICNQIFKVAQHSPTRDSWRNVIDPNRNTLSEIKRAKIKLPDSSEINELQDQLERIRAKFNLPDKEDLV